MVNEPSVFEPWKFYCTLWMNKHEYIQVVRHRMYFLPTLGYSIHPEIEEITLYNWRNQTKTDIKLWRDEMAKSTDTDRNNLLICHSGNCCILVWTPLHVISRNNWIKTNAKSALTLLRLLNSELYSHKLRSFQLSRFQFEFYLENSKI